MYSIDNLISDISKPVPVDVSRNWELEKLLNIIKVLDYKEARVSTKTYGIFNYMISAMGGITLYAYEEMTWEKEDDVDYIPFHTALEDALRGEFSFEVKVKKGDPVGPYLLLWSSITDSYPFSIDSPLYKHIKGLKGFSVSVPDGIDDMEVATIMVHSGDLKNVDCEIPFLDAEQTYDGLRLAYVYIPRNSPLPFGLPYTYIKEVNKF